MRPTLDLIADAERRVADAQAVGDDAAEVKALADTIRLDPQARQPDRPAPPARRSDRSFLAPDQVSGWLRSLMRGDRAGAARRLERKQRRELVAFGQRVRVVGRSCEGRARASRGSASRTRGSRRSSTSSSRGDPDGEPDDESDLAGRRCP